MYPGMLSDSRDATTTDGRDRIMSLQAHLEAKDSFIAKIQVTFL